MGSLTQYNSVKSQLRPGDVIIFQGSGALSASIEIFSDGPSHSGFIRQPVTDQGEDAILCQSTIETWNGQKRNGVQSEPLGLTVAGYDGPWIAALLLNDATRARIDWQKFYAIIGAADGVLKYDIPGLFEFLARQVPILGNYIFQAEHTKGLVCSAWTTFALIGCGAISPTINWTKAMPQTLVEMGIYKGYVALLGTPKLRRFNTA